MISRTFGGDYTLSEIDQYTVIIVLRLELKFNATKVEIDDTRFLSCLSLVPLAMEATAGGSGGIPPDPSPETGQKYIWYEEFAEQNVHVVGQGRAFDYTWFKQKDPWDSEGHMETAFQVATWDEVGTRGSYERIKRGKNNAS